MIRRPPRSTRTDTLVPYTTLFRSLCVSVLVARVSGAHMHFCLDGSEPRASLHVMDGFDMRHDAGMDAPHHDVDILLGEQTLSKSGQLSVDLPLQIGRAHV